MTFNKVDFILAFAVSFPDRTFHLRSLSGLVCGEQDLITLFVLGWGGKFALLLAILI